VSDHGATTKDGHATPVPMPVARFDDPHIQPSARNPARTEGLVGLALAFGLAGFVAFGVAYWINAKPWVIGAAFGIGFCGTGAGLTAWGKYLMPQGPFVEDRHPLAGTPEEQAALAAVLVDRSTIVVQRRGFLGLLLAGGMGVFGVVAMFPLLRSLGPLPKKSLDTTNWKKVDISGRRVHVDDLQVGGILTVFPEGHHADSQAQAIDQTVLIRLDKAGDQTAVEREVAGYVAFSKLCTHLGCPVGLYEQQLEKLVCPCHQSIFAVRNRCLPEFGPAPRPLPELRINVDSRGYLRASAGYDQAVGPGFWERTTTQ
jgi:ubiquinol-cytochrome c reductase iron-sulfur subunit